MDAALHDCSSTAAERMEAATSRRAADMPTLLAVPGNSAAIATELQPTRQWPCWPCWQPAVGACRLALRRGRAPPPARVYI
jgi:hypothetical protein